jgi:bifunctional DNase/RNase
MDPAVRHPSGGDRSWEYRLLPLLVMAFGAASGATLASPGPIFTVTHRRAPLSAPSTQTASFEAKRGLATKEIAGLDEVRIVDVVVNEGDNTSVVLLIDRNAETVIPIFVERADGQIIREQLKASHAPSKTAELKSLLLETINSQGGTVERVEVRERKDDSFRSQVVLRRSNADVAVDAKLPEALALAASMGTPVFVERAVMSDQGIRKAAIMNKPEGFPSPLRKPESL